MKLTFRTLVIAAGVVGAPAFAQSEGTETQTENIGIETNMPGMPMPMNMNVKVKQTVTTTHTTTTTTTAPAAPAAAPMVMGRDCGTGNDPGCTMRRHNELPMDAETFKAFMQSLRSNDNEINRSDIAVEMLKSNYLTALQLGQVLDVFQNEIYRYDISEKAAPHVVNPKHAMGLSSKFQNSIYATDFSKLMAKQK